MTALLSPLDPPAIYLSYVYHNHIAKDCLFCGRNTFGSRGRVLPFLLWRARDLSERQIRGLLGPSGRKSGCNWAIAWLMALVKLTGLEPWAGKSVLVTSQKEISFLLLIMGRVTCVKSQEKNVWIHWNKISSYEWNELLSMLVELWIKEKIDNIWENETIPKEK